MMAMMLTSKTYVIGDYSDFIDDFEEFDVGASNRSMP